jgi:hypothetical protein
MAGRGRRRSRQSRKDDGGSRGVDGSAEWLHAGGPRPASWPEGARRSIAAVAEDKRSDGHPSGHAREPLFLRESIRRPAAARRLLARRLSRRRDHAGRPGRARSIRPHGNRVVLAVRRRETARVWHGPRRRSDRDPPSAGRRCAKTAPTRDLECLRRRAVAAGQLGVSVSRRLSSHGRADVHRRAGISRIVRHALARWALAVAGRLDRSRHQRPLARGFRSVSQDRTDRRPRRQPGLTGTGAGHSDRRDAVSADDQRRQPWTCGVRSACRIRPRLDGAT